MRRLAHSLASSLLVLAACARATPDGPSPARAPDHAAPSAAPPRDAFDGSTPLTRLAPPASPSAKPAEAPASAALATSLLRALAAAPEDVAVSPPSLRSALAMAALGARGVTLDELAAALRVDRDPAAHRAAAKAERARMREAAGAAALHSAARVWLDRSVPLAPSFAADCADGYGAAAAPLDFARGVEAARTTINRWAKDETRGAIGELLPKGALSPSARLVLTSAVHFRGEWAVPFSKTATKDAVFHGAAGDVTLPRMQRTGTMRYAATDEVELVELPYKGSELSFLVALPRPAVSLGAMLGELSEGELTSWTASLHPEHVALALPRFTVAWGRSLRRELEVLGIKSAFTSDADFGAITQRAPGLYLHDVVHKALVQVDETGTEAAAATGALLFPTSAPVAPPRPVIVDRPFLFFVRHAATGEVLFAGRVSAPKRP